MKVPPVVARILVAVAVIGWGRTAVAHPGYPPAIDSALGEPNQFVENEFKPTACQLCHTSTGGGTALVAFGTLMVSNYGLSNDPINEDDGSLKQAMIGLAENDPAAITDLKKGVDPNSDSEVFAQALPQPEYGCTTVPAKGQPPYPGFLFAIVPVALLLERRRRDSVRAERSGLQRS